MASPIATLEQPIDLAVRAESPDIWVAERSGVVKNIEIEAAEPADEPSAPITIQNPTDVVLDISDQVNPEGEGGLLGIAFSPDGSALYTSYTNLEGNSVISEFSMDGDVAGEEERILFEATQPFSNHNGGQILFGPDDFLYIALGDGGSGGDPKVNGQNLETHLGSVLRIDPNENGAAPYSVPDSNPFSADESPENPNSKPEIWLYGVRNPWRFSFDTKTGDLWIADVGQDRFEEINYLEASEKGAGRGANLGWNLTEGTNSFQGNPIPKDQHDPLFTYETNEKQCSVVGGHVYRGSAIADLDGVYLFSDFCSGSILGLEQESGEVTTTAPLTFDRDFEQVISLGEGPSGEIYILEQSGQVSRITEVEGGGEGVA